MTGKAIDRPNDELHARSTSAVYDDGRDFHSGRLAKSTLLLRYGVTRLTHRGA